MRKGNAFVWHARIKRIGIPVAVIAAARRLSRGDGVIAACRSAAVVLSFVWLEAELEFDWRHQWRRRAGGTVSRTMYIQTN
jgi:hypothetical protein